MIPPVDPRNGPAQCSPSALIDDECNRFLAVRNQVGTQDWPHTGGDTGPLELDGTVDAISIGACQCAETLFSSCLRQRLGTGYTESEGEVGVNVEVAEHLHCSLPAAHC